MEDGLQQSRGNNIRSGSARTNKRRCLQREAIAGVAVVGKTLMCKCVDGGVERDKGARGGECWCVQSDVLVHAVCMGRCSEEMCCLLKKKKKKRVLIF